MKLAIIPARGGSKRIPRKNIKIFCGKPMLAWSISAALDSACFDRVIVSTDDEDIATVAKEYGAEVPFMRPPELANDYAGTMPVIAHAVRWQQAHGTAAQLACCIYATAPFITAADLQRGYNMITSTDADYAFTVTHYASPIQRALCIQENGRLSMLQPEKFNIRSQDLEEAYHDAGQFYWGTSQAWLEGKTIFSANSLPILLPRYRVQDIDTVDDWMRAELMFKAQFTR